MYFLFMRHAEYEQPDMVPSALLPHPLTLEGRGQSLEGAKKVKDFLYKNSDLSIVSLHCSKALRAYETADILKTELELDLEMNQTDDLLERNMGPMANLRVDEIERIVDRDPRLESLPEGWKSSRDYCLPYKGAESLAIAGKRVAKYISSVKLEANGLNVFVGHGASFRHAAHELGILKLEDIPKLSMYYAEPLVFKFEEGKWRLIFGQWKVRARKENID